MRMLVRHQWVREHGTPRLTTLAGAADAGHHLWLEWLTSSGRARERRRLFEPGARADRGWLDRTVDKAMALAIATPRAPVAIAVEPALLDGWLAAHDDREGAFVKEGVVPVVAAPAARGARHTRARSLAELTLYEALEATEHTRGRFVLNETLSFMFGSRSAEIDLLSRQDEIAIEVDGYHHFQDADHYRRDRRKDLLIQAHGYAVLRFLAEDVHADPRACVQIVIELLGRTLHRSRSRRSP
jgi:very-short-patch-repair endonuclease